MKWLQNNFFVFFLMLLQHIFPILYPPVFFLISSIGKQHKNCLFIIHCCLNRINSITETCRIIEVYFLNSHLYKIRNQLRNHFSFSFAIREFFTTLAKRHLKICQYCSLFLFLVCLEIELQNPYPPAPPTPFHPAKSWKEDKEIFVSCLYHTAIVLPR
jgi:hypothetical protein